jgi:Luciferase-like monooxygenase
MRLGLDLRSLPPSEREAVARQADALGFWAVLIDGSDALVEAAALAVVTEHVILAVSVDTAADHPFTLAEEIAVLDHLSRRRALVVADGPEVARLRAWLAGEIIDGAALTPPPAQTVLTVWDAGVVTFIELTGDEPADRALIDRRRDAGVTHAFVGAGPLLPMARHLATRASVAAFPQLVADLADHLGD